MRVSITITSAAGDQYRRVFDQGAVNTVLDDELRAAGLKDVLLDLLNDWGELAVGDTIAIREEA